MAIAKHIKGPKEDRVKHCSRFCVSARHWDLHAEHEDEQILTLMWSDKYGGGINRATESHQPGSTWTTRQALLWVTVDWSDMQIMNLFKKTSRRLLWLAVSATLFIGVTCAQCCPWVSRSWDKFTLTHLGHDPHPNYRNSQRHHPAQTGTGEQV